MKKEAKKMCGFIFAAIVLVGLVLAVVGMFVGQMVSTVPIVGSTTTELFNEYWGVKEVLGVEVGVSNTFAIISFIITVVGAAVLLVDAILRVFLGKNLKLVRLIGVAVTFVGAILILVSGLIIVNDCWDMLLGESGKAQEVLEKAGYGFSCGAGVWLGFIGGLVATVGGALPLVKAFN